jgi:hypothetical protein
VQRVTQPVAGVVRPAERAHRPGDERLAAEGLLVPRIQLVPDEIIDRDDARRIFLEWHAQPHLGLEVGTE